jgi:hypothetical protein
MPHYTQQLIINGRSLTEWGTRYGLTRQRLHQLYQKHGTISDDIMANRGLIGSRLGCRYKKVKVWEPIQFMSDFELSIITMVRKRYPTIKTFSQVLEMSDHQLLLVPNLGRKRLAQIQQQRK